MSTATTCIPIALAYCTAIWPRPPMPMMATHWPRRTSFSFSPLQTAKRTISAYENRIAVLETEKLMLAEEAEKIAEPERPFDEMFEHAMNFLSNHYEIWQNGDLATKRTVIRLVFSSPLIVSRKFGVRTGESSYPFKALRFLESSDLRMVRAPGPEPLRFRSAVRDVRGFPAVCRVLPPPLL